MKSGTTYSFGDVILCQMQFVDTFEIKTRPALVLFEEHGNVVVAGITSNTKMQGISLSKEEGAATQSVIKLNYIFTIAHQMVRRQLFQISQEKKKVVIHEIMKRFE